MFFFEKKTFFSDSFAKFEISLENYVSIKKILTPSDRSGSIV